MDSASAPGFSEIASHFSVDIPWIVALAAAGGLAVAGFVRARRGPARPHPRWRLMAFLAGLVAVALAVLSPIEHYGNQVLWVDFLGFLILTMVAAPLLVLGAPLTLAFRVTGPAGRRRLRAFYRGPVMSVLTFPVFTWLAFAVVTYVWQFTGWTETAARNAAVRDIQLATLLLASFLFWMPALCADPCRWRMAWPLRALYVFVEMTHKGLFGGMFLSASTPFHERWSEWLPAWAPSPIDDQRIAILILWVGGNLIFLVALAGIIAGWLRYERRMTHRIDWRLRLRREAEARRRVALEQVFRRGV